MAVDLKKANEYYLKAANLGHDGALYAVGYNYQYGIGLDVNCYIANQYYLKAANSGHNNASYMLGHNYMSGIGCAVDYAKAWRYFRICEKNMIQMRLIISAIYTKMVMELLPIIAKPLSII